MGRPTAANTAAVGAGARTAPPTGAVPISEWGNQERLWNRSRRRGSLPGSSGDASPRGSISMVLDLDEKEHRLQAEYWGRKMEVDPPARSGASSFLRKARASALHNQGFPGTTGASCPAPFRVNGAPPPAPSTRTCRLLSSAQKSNLDKKLWPSKGPLSNF
jgi:hypothetical protein